MASGTSKRPLIVGVVCAVLFALVYIAAIGVYANSGRSTVAEVPKPVENGVDVGIELVSVDSMRREATMRVIVSPNGDMEDKDGLGFTKPLRINFWQTTGDGPSSYADVAVGQAYLLKEITVLITGSPDSYPRDHYLYGGTIETDDSGQQIGEQIPYPFLSIVELDASGSPKQPLADQFDPSKPSTIPIGMSTPPEGGPGWSENWVLETQGSTLWMHTTFKRAGGTVAFVVVVMILMAVLAVAALSVSIRVYRKPGTIEATMASWQAALLFALIPLRNFLPGAPPIGAWIDILVFYWVILALMLSMTLFTYTWLRDKGHLPGEKKSKIS